ncbi:hypothetical protein RIR_jg32367.t5 [Rhizophagus irregularis DAOM 181602=DAOM 197198]|nr:hypothetical protein RIR_jg32367.t5 [Rhizophagus irregularis DAOM 181602=DAOM 197198]
MNREETQLRNPKWKILTCIISGHGTKIKAFQKTINLHRLQTWIYWYAERSLDPTTCAYKIRMRKDLPITQSRVTVPQLVKSTNM